VTSSDQGLTGRAHRAWQRHLASIVVASSLAALILLCSASAALALDEHAPAGAFGEAGSAGGQFSEPGGVAVNDATHDVYVVDRGNNRVEQFSADGVTVLGEFDGSGSPAGVFSAPEGIAVDNSESPLDTSAGDVYVVDTGHKVIDKLGPTGTFEGELTATEAGPFEELEGVAVDSTGTVWVYEKNPESCEGTIDEFSDLGAFLHRFGTGRCGAPGLTVNPLRRTCGEVRHGDGSRTRRMEAWTAIHRGRNRGRRRPR
jgi:DNA-binding beta-propeller fold protein YncE